MAINNSAPDDGPLPSPDTPAASQRRENRNKHPFHVLYNVGYLGRPLLGNAGSAQFMWRTMHREVYYNFVYATLKGQ